MSHIGAAQRRGFFEEQQRSRAAEQRVRQLLIDRGYAEEAIVSEFGAGDRAVDLAVVDPESGQPLLLLEVKAASTPQALAQAATQLRAAQQRLEPLQVRTFVALVTTDISIHEVNRDVDVVSQLPVPADVITSPPAELPSPLRAKAEAKSRTIAAFLSRLRKATDTFSIVSWALAAGAAVLLWLDYAEVLRLDVRQLSLLGVIIVLILAPFSRKLKILGIEFERFERRANKESE